MKRLANLPSWATALVIFLCAALVVLLAVYVLAPAIAPLMPGGR